MEPHYILNTLTQALSTIEQQRKTIERLQPLADAYQRIGQVLDLGKKENDWGTLGVDVTYGIRRTIETIHSEFKDGAQEFKDGAQEWPPETTEDASGYANTGSGLGRAEMERRKMQHAKNRSRSQAAADLGGAGTPAPIHETSEGTAFSPGAGTIEETLISTGLAT